MKYRRIGLSALAFLLLLPVPPAFSAPAQKQPAKPQAAPASTAPGPAAPATTPEKKEARGYTLSPEKYAKAVAYSRAHYRLYFIDVVYGVAVLLLVLGLRWAPRFRDWAERASARRFVQALVFVPLLTLTTDVLGLPTSLYGHWLELQYDQSVQGWGSWFWDWTKGELIGLVISILLVWILYGIIRRSPRLWWLYFWLATLPIIVFLLFIAPVVIQPLFFKFEPLEKNQPQLVAEIEKVAQRGGLAIPRERMFEMKASEKLKSVSAYVTGIGASKRVVVWDTTIEKMTIPQTLFVFGHEMGHYVLGHVWRGIAFTSVLLLVFFFAGYHGLHAALGRWGERWAIRGADDWASLPAFLLLLSVLSFAATPALTAFRRYQEHQADIYGLEVIHGIVPDAPQVATGAFQVLGEIDLADPDPPAFIRIWLYSHPPLNERIVFAQTYDPWSKGEKPEYVPAQ